MSEEELERLIRQKDNRGFIYLYTNVFTMCWKPMSNSRVREEDHRVIFHESVVILLEKIHDGTYRHDAKVSTFLCQICKYKAINESRRLAREKGKYIPDFRYTDADEQDTPASLQDTTLWEHELSEIPEEKLVKAFQQLGERCKEILTAYYYDDKSIKELSLQFEKTENAAKQAKYKCIQRLKDKFLKG